VLALPDWLFFRVAAAMLRIDPEARSSMWEDLERGRTTEVDFINGEVVRLAREVGVEAPYNARAVDLVREAEARGAGSPGLDADALERALGA